MKTFKFSLVLCTRENTDVFITLDENIYGIHSKTVNILYLFYRLQSARFISQRLKVRFWFDPVREDASDLFDVT